jgi:type II secretory pathway pseudopilin PulG
MTLFMPAASRPYKHRHRRHGGFTYLGLLILIAIIGIASAATLQMGAVLQRHVAEEELLEIGAEFRAGLVSYANAAPVGQPRAPQSLQDLLKDPRYPNVRRHLRKLYTDPITGKEGWGTVQAPDGSGIVAVYSLSEAKPIKIGNFAPEFQNLAEKTSYRDWIFWVSPQAAATSINRTPQPASLLDHASHPLLR